MTGVVAVDVVIAVLAWTGLFLLGRKVVRDRRARKINKES